MNRRKQAKQLLVHYLTLALERAKVRVDWDNQAEIENIIDLIFDEIESQMGQAQTTNGQEQ